jgi:hypothetical protein
MEIKQMPGLAPFLFSLWAVYSKTVLQQMKFISKNAAVISLILGVLTIAILLWINLQIAHQYDSSDGKTRGLYGLIEIQYLYKYYLLISGFAALMLAIYSFRTPPRKTISVTALVCALLSIAFVFLRLWTFMAHKYPYTFDAR